jgi:D-Tyr-tRNAtyr deacylase
LKKRGQHNAGNRSPRLRRLQAKKLFNDQEQEKYSRQDQLGEILPVLPQTYYAQGNQGITGYHREGMIQDTGQ